MIQHGEALWGVLGKSTYLYFGRHGKAGINRSERACELREMESRENRNVYCEIKCMNTAALSQTYCLHERTPHLYEVASFDHACSSDASADADCAQYAPSYTCSAYSANSSETSSSHVSTIKQYLQRCHVVDDYSPRDSTCAAG